MFSAVEPRKSRIGGIAAFPNSLISWIFGGLLQSTFYDNNIQNVNFSLIYVNDNEIGKLNNKIGMIH